MEVSFRSRERTLKIDRGACSNLSFPKLPPGFGIQQPGGAHQFVSVLRLQVQLQVIVSVYSEGPVVLDVALPSSDGASLDGKASAGFSDRRGALVGQRLRSLRGGTPRARCRNQLTRVVDGAGA